MTRRITPKEVEDPVLRAKLNSANRVYSDTGYGDYLVPGLSVETRGPDAPDLVELRTNIRLPAFAGTGVTVEQAFFSIHILHDYKANTTPTFHVHWTHNNASPSGDVKWHLDYSVARGYSADTYPATTTVTTTQTAGAQYTHHITDDDDDMPLNGTLEPDAVVICRIYRDPADVADTFADDAFLVNVDLHYELGQIATPERNRPFAGF